MPRIPFGVFSTLALLPLAFSQQPPPHPPSVARPATPDNTKLGPWRNIKGSPLEFAKKGDTAFSHFKGIEGRAETQLDYDGQGHSMGEIEIRSPQVFKIQYAWVHYPRKAKDYPISMNVITSNGPIVDVNGSELEHYQLPTNKFRFYDGNSVQDWVLGYPKYFFGAIRGERPLEDLVARAMRPGGGYTVTFQLRDVVNRGTPGQQVGTVISRTAAAARREGPLRIEIIADPKTGIPVTADLTTQAPGHKPVHVFWNGGWRQNNTFPDSDFHLNPWPPPKKAKGR